MHILILTTVKFIDSFFYGKNVLFLIFFLEVKHQSQMFTNMITSQSYTSPLWV